MSAPSDYMTRAVGQDLFLLSRRTGKVIRLGGRVGIRLFELMREHPAVQVYECARREMPEANPESLATALARLGRLMEHDRGTVGADDALNDAYDKEDLVFRAHYEITNHCNLSCSFCYNANDRAKGELFVTRSEFCRVVTELSSRGVITLTLTGGEPTLHPDIEFFLRFLAERDLWVMINTNGCRVPKALQDPAVKRAISLVDVSVYGFSEAAYRAVAGKPVFRILQRNVEELRSLGVPLRLKYLLHVGNQHDIEDFLAYCHTEGLSYSVSSGVFWSNSGRPASETWPDRAVMDRLLGKTWPYLSTLRNGGSLRSACTLPKSRVCIATDGTVFPCELVRIPLGTLREQALQRIIQSQPRMLTSWAEQNRSSASSSECARCSKERFCIKCPAHSYRSGGGFNGKVGEACAMADYLMNALGESRHDCQHTAAKT